MPHIFLKIWVMGVDFIAFIYYIIGEPRQHNQLVRGRLFIRRPLLFKEGRYFLLITGNNRKRLAVHGRVAYAKYISHATLSMFGLPTL